MTFSLRGYEKWSLKMGLRKWESEWDLYSERQDIGSQRTDLSKTDASRAQDLSLLCIVWELIHTQHTGIATDTHQDEPLHVRACLLCAFAGDGGCKHVKRLILISVSFCSCSNP